MSFSKLSHKFAQLKAKFGDKLYSAIYYGLMPTIIVVGKQGKSVGLLKKPRNEFVDRCLSSFTKA